MENIKQCWAFHRDGARCEHPAGHPGEHAVQKTWNDLQCATPGEFGEPATSKTGISEAPPVLPKEPEPAANCVACSHKHKGGTCRCGCYEFVG
jgi:hypothetical protein